MITMPLADVLDDGQAKTRPLDVLERLGIVDPVETLENAG